MGFHAAQEKFSKFVMVRVSTRRIFNFSGLTENFEIFFSKENPIKTFEIFLCA